MLRRHLSGQKGFTLIELLVVVAILGVLATIAVPRVMDAIDNARARKAESDLTIIRDALERFYLDFGIFPPNLSTLAELMFIDPNFKFKNSYGYYYFYAVLWQGTNDPTNLTDYVLGDPGKVPFEITGNQYWNATKVSVGANVAAQQAYFWSTAGVTQAVNLDAQTYQVTGVVSGKTFNLADYGDGTAATELIPIEGPNGMAKPVSAAIVYTGK